MEKYEKKKNNPLSSKEKKIMIFLGICLIVLSFLLLYYHISFLNQSTKTVRSHRMKH